MEVLLFIVGLLFGVILTCIVFYMHFINKFNRLCETKSDEFMKTYMSVKSVQMDPKNLADIHRQMHKDFLDDWKRIVEDFDKTNKEWEKYFKT